MLSNEWFKIGYCDSPRALQRSFQDPATGYMEGVVSFNNHLLVLIAAIIVLVGWMMVNILTTHLELDASCVRSFYHSNTIEIIWTVVPALLLLGMAYPSFTLLFSLFEG
jgi:heme/copper-type cytochrome/quinol oxidase subunit 2